MNPYVIYRPVITEKSLRMAKESNGYTFYVDLRADKKAIREAVEAAYEVTVEDIKTIRIPGKVKKTGSKRRLVQQNDRKKAIVFLPAGQKIAVFEM